MTGNICLHIKQMPETYRLLSSNMTLYSDSLIYSAMDFVLLELLHTPQSAIMKTVGLKDLYTLVDETCKVLKMDQFERKKENYL